MEEFEEFERVPVRELVRDGLALSILRVKKNALGKPGPSGRHRHKTFGWHTRVTSTIPCKKDKKGPGYGI